MSDDVSSIIRSIRVATALNERVGVLMQGGEFDREVLANRLGELRQLYPEVWSHLDDAREQLVARGSDVAHYDALRARPATHAGGVLQVHVADFGDDGPNSAQLNHEGHALATEAIYVLRAALPQVDWMGLEEAERRELEAIGSLGPAAWKKAVFGLIAVVLVGGAIAIFIYLQITAGGGDDY
jgi:hypothetical protein